MVCLLSALAFHEIGTQLPADVWIALEALRDAWRTQRFAMEEPERHARICRVERVMRPYLDAVVS